MNLINPRNLYRLFLLCIWLLVVLLVGESTLRIYEYIVCKTNPLILSLNNQPPWTHSESIHEARAQTIIYPPPSIIDWLTNRARFFLQLDEQDRLLFSSFYQIAILVQEDEGQHPIIYLPSPSIQNFFKGDIIVSILNKEKNIVKYYPSFTKGEMTISDLFFCPLKDETDKEFLICWYKTETIDTNETKSESDIWEIPYFEYKKHAQLPSYEFHTNNFGFRDEDIVVPKPQGVFRILCIGGSTTEEGPTEKETYPNFLEKLLIEEYKGPYKIEVINAGIPGISANKLWLRLPDFVFIQPDLVIYCEGANDITHILLPYWIKNLPQIKKFAIHFTLFRNCFPLYFLPDKDKIQEDLQKDILSYIEKIHNYLENKKIGFAIMSMPAPNYSLMSRVEKNYFQYVTRKWWGGDFINYRMYYYVLHVYNQLINEQFSDKADLYIPMYEMFQQMPPSCFNDLCHQKLKGIQKKAEVSTSFLLKYLQKLQIEDNNNAVEK